MNLKKHKKTLVLQSKTVSSIIRNLAYRQFLKIDIFSCCFFDVKIL